MAQRRLTSQRAPPELLSEDRSSAFPEQQRPPGLPLSLALAFELMPQASRLVGITSLIALLDHLIRPRRRWSGDSASSPSYGGHGDPTAPPGRSLRQGWRWSG